MTDGSLYDEDNYWNASFLIVEMFSDESEYDELLDELDSYGYTGEKPA